MLTISEYLGHGNLKLRLANFYSKTKNSDSFQYDISNLDKTKKYYGFNSSMDINFDEGISSNPELCVAIWGAIAAPSAKVKKI